MDAVGVRGTRSSPGHVQHDEKGRKRETKRCYSASKLAGGCLGGSTMVGKVKLPGKQKGFKLTSWEVTPRRSRKKKVSRQNKKRRKGLLG